MDWSHFTKRIHIAAPKNIVFRAWTTPEGLEQWFLRLAEFKNKQGISRRPDEVTEPGDHYRWRWHGWGDEMTHEGTILLNNDDDELIFTFDAGSESEDMQVQIQLESGHGGTMVTLKQFNIPTDEESRAQFHVGCLEGWTFYLANLKSILEGGIDLRNKDQSIQEVINA
ncbi:MAG: SRPBCC domain-containing protein [Saprospiraceae bacterium]|nr:SRPBCC domain-containing protein [Saprospiraceae bacterium]